jgi:hypothetical protein
MIYITLTANNDVNGNRRQLWIIIDQNGLIIDVIRHEDGKGMCSPQQVYAGVVAGPSITVSSNEFNRWLKMHDTPKEMKAISHANTRW